MRRLLPALVCLAPTAWAASPATYAPAFFEIIPQSDGGGGWVLHHLPGRGDTLWSCADVTQMTECAQVFLDDWRPGAEMTFLHVSDGSYRAWLRLHVPGVGDHLLACDPPGRDPHCRPVDLPTRPTGATLTRSWPAPSDTVLESPKAADMWLAAGTRKHGAVNLYACTGLATTPRCAAGVPNWLAVDRAPIGLRRVEPASAYDGSTVRRAGVRVDAVDPESAASTSGLASGAIVVAVGDVEVRSTAHLRHLLAQVPAGHSIDVALANGDTVTLTPARRSATPGRGWLRGGPAVVDAEAETALPTEVLSTESDDGSEVGTDTSETQTERRRSDRRRRSR